MEGKIGVLSTYQKASSVGFHFYDIYSQYDVLIGCICDIELKDINSESVFFPHNTVCCPQFSLRRKYSNHAGFVFGQPL